MVSRLVAESPDDSGVSSSLCLLYKPLYVAVRTSKNGLQECVSVFVCMCVYITCVLGTHGAQKAASNPLGLELRV